MRLIDADTLRQEVEKDRDASDMPKMWYQGVEYAINHIIHAPTVDAEPVKHGHWEVVDGTEPRRYGCSVCKRLSWTEDNYCSYCGAEMDEVTGE